MTPFLPRGKQKRPNSRCEFVQYTGGNAPVRAEVFKQTSNNEVGLFRQKNLGQKILMGRRFLERRVVTRNSLFNRQLTGKNRHLKTLSIGF